MTRLHPVRARELIRYLKSLGFTETRQQGSHKFFRHPDGRTATVPNHRGRSLPYRIFLDRMRQPIEPEFECGPPTSKQAESSGRPPTPLQDLHNSTVLL